MNLTMIGGGYVGLVTAACLADFGHRVTVVDKEAGRIDALLAGRVPIHEPGLDSLIEANRREDRLNFTTDVAAAVADADAVFIAVGTPTRMADGHADLSFVFAAVREIAPSLRSDAVVITKSTVPVGTGDAVEKLVRELRPGEDILVASNPEFLRAGAAINDFKRPDRIVVGSDDARARDVMTEIYRPLYLNQSPIIFTDRRTAELTKYAANAFLATKITFINEIADLCEAVGGNVQDIARGIGLDNRIGSKFLHPGPGFGGSCFPKDTLALVRTGEAHDVALSVVSAAHDANDRRKLAMAARILAVLGKQPAGKTVGVLGLTFKPNTDDMREAPSLVILPALVAAGVNVRAYDPKGMDAARPLLPGVAFVPDAYSCAANADTLVILTEWDAFRALDLGRLKRAMARPMILDLRNIYRPLEMKAAGITYHSIGRMPVEG